MNLNILTSVFSNRIWLRVRVRNCASFLFYAQRFESGDDVEQFLVDPTLAQTMKRSVEIIQNSSMFLSARCIAASRLAFSLERDSAHARKSEMKRYSRMSARKVG